MKTTASLILLFTATTMACTPKGETPVQAAPVSAPAPAPTPPPAPTEDEVNVEKAKAAVLAVLKDPGSAQFSDVKGGTVNGVGTVCGKINAKNSMGGYNGPKPFCWTTSNGLMEIPE